MKISVFYPHVLAAVEQEGTDLESILIKIKNCGVDQVYMDYPAFKRDVDICKRLEAVGLSISGFFDFYDFGNNPDVDGAKQVIDIAQKLEVEHFLIIPGMGDIKKEENKLALMKKMTEVLQRCCDYAVGSGVCIEMEDTDDPNAPYRTMDELLWFMEHVQGLGCCFDTGNFLCSEIDVMDAFCKLEPYICNFHLKDRGLAGVTPISQTVNGRDLYMSSIGRGCIDIANILERAKQNGYSGSLNMELFGSENYLNDIRESAQWLQKWR